MHKITGIEISDGVNVHIQGRLGMEKVERRGKPRIYEPFLAEVRGMDAAREAFDIHTVIDNMSTSGLYMRIARQVETGAKLFTIVQLSTAPVEKERGVNRVATRGVVVRSEALPDGLCGVAVKFTRYRFL